MKKWDYLKLNVFAQKKTITKTKGQPHLGSAPESCASPKHFDWYFPACRAHRRCGSPDRSVTYGGNNLLFSFSTLSPCLPLINTAFRIICLKSRLNIVTQLQSLLIAQVKSKFFNTQVWSLSFYLLFSPVFSPNCYQCLKRNYLFNSLSYFILYGYMFC